MQKEMSMKVNGKMTRPMDSEFTPTLTEADTRASGTRTNSTATASNSGQTGHATRATTRQA